MNTVADGATRTPRSPLAQRGAGLAEALVGTLVGLVAALVMLGALASAEGFKRDAAGLAEAAQTATLTAFALGAEIANAGQGLAAAAGALASCPDTGDIRSTLRPIAVLITAGTGSTESDTVVVSYGASSAVATPMPLASAAPGGSDLRVRAPLGFAAGDRIVAAGAAGQCAAATATAVSPPDVLGIVDVTHTGIPLSLPAEAAVVDLGPAERVRRVRYDVVDGTLRSLDLAAPGATPNPLASSVAVLKLQYGIDSDDDGALDRWVSADVPPWDPASVLAAPASVLARIKAVRLGLIVRSETVARALRAPFSWQLFDCGESDDVPCPGRLAGTLPASRRYQVYETVVPLRNVIWNARP
jgi:type IV pilus assembly protein PilW